MCSEEQKNYLHDMRSRCWPSAQRRSHAIPSAGTKYDLEGHDVSIQDETSNVQCPPTATLV